MLIIYLPIRNFMIFFKIVIFEKIIYYLAHSNFDKLPLPPELDIIKMDIDSFDCDIMQSIIGANFHAKFVITEVFDGYPPPYGFSLHYSKQSDEELYNPDFIN